MKLKSRLFLCRLPRKDIILRPEIRCFLIVDYLCLRTRVPRRQRLLSDYNYCMYFNAAIRYFIVNSRFAAPYQRREMGDQSQASIKFKIRMGTFFLKFQSTTRWYRAAIPLLFSAGIIIIRGHNLWGTRATTKVTRPASEKSRGSGPHTQF